MKIPTIALLMLLVPAGLLANDNAPAPDPDALAIRRGHRMDHPRCSLKTFSLLYTNLTGQQIDVPDELAEIEFSVLLPGPLTNRDAARFLRNQLLLEGLILKQAKPGKLQIALGGGAWMPPVAGVKQPDKRPGPNPLAIATPEGQLFQHPGIDLVTASLLYYELTGKRVLLPARLRSVIVSIEANGPLTNAEAAALIQVKLLANGIFLVEFVPHEVAMFAINPSVAELAKQNALRGVSPRVRRLPTRVRRLPAE